MSPHLCVRETHWFSYAYAPHPVIYHETVQPNCVSSTHSLLPQHISNIKKGGPEIENCGATKTRVNSLIVTFQKNEKRFEMFMQQCM
jgi:hypothetical protein